mmetsp:Transcript_17965/g.27121  ORF Transcript_17965/g.27121 Transcript_17965/m.27121 type:complete len:251 (+) Transcript_17965:62-814(+)
MLPMRVKDKDSDKGKGVSNVERRTWDASEYEEKVQERLDKEEAVPQDEPIVLKKEIPVLPRGTKGTKEEFCAASVDAIGPMGSERAYLKNREKKVNLEAKLHTTQIITSTTSADKQGGWWCEVCKCLLKDSLNYLDHINGKKHQRALGYSMRVERSTASQVRNRFKSHRQKRQLAALGAQRRRETSALEDYEQRLERQLEEEEQRKRQRKEAKEAKKREDQAQAEEEAVSSMDPEMMKMMGFGGFGTSKA